MDRCIILTCDWLPYQIQYDPQNIISYVGIERNIIEYDFKKNEWHIKERVQQF